MPELEELVERARRAFEATDALSQDASGMWPRFEIVDAEIVEDTPTFLVITRHSLAGVAFPPDGRLGKRIDIGDYPHRVVSRELAGLGPYVSVVLVENVRRLPSPAHARKTAHQLGPSFRSAVAKTRRALRAARPPLLAGA